MKITAIKLSVLEDASQDRIFGLHNVPGMARIRWTHSVQKTQPGFQQFLHVETDEGIEGIVTASNPDLRANLEQLRALVIGENPLDRERIWQKLHQGTRWVYRNPGWFASLDNCLWDIAGKAAGLPVYHLIGRVRESMPCYLNIGGATVDEAVEDAEKAVEEGFPATKDHFYHDVAENIRWLTAIRKAVGEKIDCMHDPVAIYTYEEAVRIGRALEDLNYRWLEEPLPERLLNRMQQLCNTLDIPILAPETMMNDVDLSAQWLISGATDLIRVTAVHGTTSALKLAHFAEMHGTTVEINGDGGLFGLVHSHLLSAISNTSYYEYFRGGHADEKGKEFGLENPVVPVNGHIKAPDGPGWGAVWDSDRFKKKLVATY